MYNNNAMTNLLSIQKQKNIVQPASRAQILVSTLIKNNIDTIFGYPGAAVLSIYNELAKTNRIKHILVRHEQAAVHAAEGYARISGKTGVVLVTSGPGFTNTITGIANAYADSTPLVVLAGDVSTNLNCGKIFQNVNIIDICKTCCKKTILLSENDDISDVIDSAISIANSGKKGPVVIALPRNILESNYNSLNKTKEDTKTTPKDFSLEINKLSEKIKNATKPLILVGGGCIDASEEILRFAEQIKCPVVSTLMGIGIYPSENSNYLGMIGINFYSKFRPQPM